MPKTQSRYQQDLGFSDGRMFISAEDVTAFGTSTLTRNAVGDISFNQGNSQTVQYSVNLFGALMRRTGFFEDLQEQYGGTGIAGSAQPQFYRPDVSLGMNTGQELQPRTAFKQKGIRLKSMDVVYLVSGAALTAHTMRIDKTIFVNNVAAAITSILASGANGLATATQANPYVTNVLTGAVAGQYLIDPDAEYWIEINAQTAGGGTYRFYGLDLIFDYNFN